MDELFHIIDRALYCHLALAVDGEPYLIPISFGRSAHSIFIHTAHEGTKVDNIRKNPMVRLAFECDVTLVTAPSAACDWSFTFSSVVAGGTIQEVTDPVKKRAGLDAIMAHCSDKQWTFPDAGINQVLVWEIPLNEITGKCSKKNL